ncbi:uncharacterized protein LOC108479853 [Gossypium arboreum]|uniref:uncharacterized protein LOC108479853 n=1 Tax=Gossypium arboreum TaxID=29729 RepID=UPI0022F19206|nr:uncharacterized protein LOC108479853 [Gossypium arboreum]
MQVVPSLLVETIGIRGFWEQEGFYNSSFGAWITEFLRLQFRYRYVNIIVRCVVAKAEKLKSELSAPHRRMVTRVASLVSRQGHVVDEISMDNSVGRNSIGLSPNGPIGLTRKNCTKYGKLWSRFCELHG